MTYDWALRGEFLDRRRELARLEEWWTSGERQPLAVLGRRRVGKSWLFRRFAHGKPAVILAAEQIPTGVQLTRFSRDLGTVLGNRPDLPDLATMFRVLLRSARDTKMLAVIDEFPWLLGSSETEAWRILSTVQAAFEEDAGASKLKVVIGGSHIGQMESLFAHRNPMYGRLIRFDVRPIAYENSGPFIDPLPPLERFERYAIAGGMPLYLTRLARGTHRDAVCRRLLDRDAPLRHEGRTIIEQELREPRIYFGVLEQLAGGRKEIGEIAQIMRMDSKVVVRYLTTLADLHLVRRRLPCGAAPTARTGHWQLDDAFLRFWFRFVFPFQDALDNGLRPHDLYDAEIAPLLSDHVASVFEDWGRAWLLSRRGQIATRIDGWWGKAANAFRRTGERSSEEIDAIGIMRSRVTLVAEMKWTNRKMGREVVSDMDRYKLPALADNGFRLAEEVKIVLFSKAGYTRSLVDLSTTDARIELVDVAEELSRTGSGAQGR